MKHRTRQQLRTHIDAALGKTPCDLLIQNVRYLDVFSCEFKSGDVGVIDGVIVGIEPGLKAKRTIDGRGRHIVPGFIDAHVHIESSLLVPAQYQRMVLPRGTTSSVCDPHELANVQGASGIEYFLQESQKSHMDLWIMLSSCVPSTDYETNGGGKLNSEELLPLMKYPYALGLAEMMNFPGVLNGDNEVLEKLESFQNVPIDGHCPMLHGHALSAYASAGISSCHESTKLEEAQEKLSKGISVWIREGSVAKDLHTLLPILSMATSTSVGFCTDDRNPLDTALEGHLDFSVRTAIQSGIAPEIVYRSASWSVARHYGLRRTGAIAPGYQADLILLDDHRTCSIAEVIKSGKITKELDWGSRDSTRPPNTVRAKTPEAKDLEGPAGRVHVIDIIPGKIVTDRSIDSHNETGIAKFSVLERYGKGQPPANAYVRGFGKNFQGAIASSVGHDHHNLLAVGSNTQDMRTAYAELINLGGGFAVVQNGKILASLALPFGGLMSIESVENVEDSLRKLHHASRSIGCELGEPFLQLAFLSLPVIPRLKLTDRGLVDVDTFRIIPVAV